MSRRPKAATLPLNITLDSLTGKGGVVLHSITQISPNNSQLDSRFDLAIVAENNAIAINLNHRDLRRSQDKYILYHFEKELDKQKIKYKTIISHPQDREGDMHNSAIDGKNLRSNRAHVHYLIIGTQETKIKFNILLQKIANTLAATPEIQLNPQDYARLIHPDFAIFCLNVCRAADLKATKIIIEDYNQQQPNSAPTSSIDPLTWARRKKKSSNNEKTP